MSRLALDIALARQASRLAHRGRRRRSRRAATRGAGERHDGDRAGALLQHAGTQEVPAHRRHRVRPLRRSVPPHRARRIPTSGFTLQHNGERALPPARAGTGARASTLSSATTSRRRPRRRRARAGAFAHRLGGPAGIRDDRARRAVPLRQRPLRARSRAHACAARGLSRRASSRPAAGVCLVAHDRAAHCRRQRPSDQEPRCDSATAARCISSCDTRSKRRWRRRRPSSLRCRPRNAWASPRRAFRRWARRRMDRAAVRVAGRDAASAPQSRRASDSATLFGDRARAVLSATLRRTYATPIGTRPAQRRRPSARFRAGAAARRLSCSRKTATAWCWSTCTRRTSACCTSGSRPRSIAAMPMQPLLVPVTFAADPLDVATADENAAVSVGARASRCPCSVPTTLAVRGVPALLVDADAVALARARARRRARIRRQPGC